MEKEGWGSESSGRVSASKHKSLSTPPLKMDKLEDIMLSEISQSQKDKYYDFL
jgi:hypothetical protein